MIPYPHINPEIVRIGPVALRWYGLMYAIGFASSYALVKYQLKKIRQGPEAGSSSKGKGKNVAAKKIPDDFLDALYTYLIVGLILGARLGYILFYDLSSYIRNPLEIVAVWHGGMSFHGGMIGSMLACYLCCRKYQVDFWQVADLVVVTTPIGLGLGRLGNFINGELFGRTTDVPWAMVFPEGGPLPRHPSQLYEFALEGIALFTILWLLKNKKHAPGAMLAACLVFYGLFRIIAEFFRQPDPQLGFIIGPFTMGQVLSALTMLGGIILYFFRKRVAAS